MKENKNKKTANAELNEENLDQVSGGLCYVGPMNTPEQNARAMETNRRVGENRKRINAERAKKGLPPIQIVG